MNGHQRNKWHRKTDASCTHHHHMPHASPNLVTRTHVTESYHDKNLTRAFAPFIYFLTSYEHCSSEEKAALNFYVSICFCYKLYRAIRQPKTKPPLIQSQHSIKPFVDENKTKQETLGCHADNLVRAWYSI